MPAFAIRHALVLGLAGSGGRTLMGAISLAGIDDGDQSPARRCPPLRVVSRHQAPHDNSAEQHRNERMQDMLETIAVLLIVLWLLGMVSSYTINGFIHILLVVAITDQSLA